MKKRKIKVLCMALCTVLLFCSVKMEALGESNEIEAENGFLNRAVIDEQIQINQLTIDEFFSHLKEYYQNNITSVIPLKDFVYEYLVTNYSYCNAELIYELIEKLNLTDTDVLKNLK